MSASTPFRVVTAAVDVPYIFVNKDKIVLPFEVQAHRHEPPSVRNNYRILQDSDGNRLPSTFTAAELGVKPDIVTDLQTWGYWLLQHDHMGDWCTSPWDDEKFIDEYDRVLDRYKELTEMVRRAMADKELPVVTKLPSSCRMDHCSCQWNLDKIQRSRELAAAASAAPAVGGAGGGAAAAAAPAAAAPAAAAPAAAPPLREFLTMSLAVRIRSRKIASMLARLRRSLAATYEGSLEEFEEELYKLLGRDILRAERDGDLARLDRRLRIRLYEIASGDYEGISNMFTDTKLRTRELAFIRQTVCPTYPSDDAPDPSNICESLSADFPSLPEAFLTKLHTDLAEIASAIARQKRYERWSETRGEF
jgi:hypothetical protein